MQGSLTALAATFGAVTCWRRAVLLLWCAAPGLTLIWAALLVLQGLLPVALIYFVKLLVDSLVVAISAGGLSALQLVVVPAALTAGTMLLVEVLQRVLEWVRAAQAECAHDYVKSLIHQKSVAVDISFYETSAYHDRLERARNEAGAQTITLLESSGAVVQHGITLLGLAGGLLLYSLWLPIVLLLSTLPALLVVMRFNRRYHQWWTRTTADRRWTNYYDMILTHHETAAEVRLFQTGPHFQAMYQALRQRLRGERLRHLRDQSLAQVAAAVISLLTVGATLGWMIWRVLLGMATLGDLAFFYQAFSRGQSLMSALLSSAGQIYASSLFLGDLFAFLDLESQLTTAPGPRQPPETLREGATFHRVTFYYPGSQTPSLRDCSLTIPAGKITAIVGENGAGKSTMLKLLCRFYDPDSGSIELDGVDLRDMTPDALHRAITVLFQAPVPYHATAAQNVALGSHIEAGDLPAIERAARAAGAHDLIKSLPQGYATLLGKWFADGVDLSGGEWQRIATARAYYRRTPLIILDEPTSFMDPWSETRWFEQFRAMNRDRTALIITHRMSIAARADLILVMHEGQLVESGTHHELIAQQGRYALSWAAQQETQVSEAIP